MSDTEQYRLHATFAVREAFQAVLTDGQGRFFLVNPSLGSHFLERSAEEIEEMLRMAAGVRRYVRSSGRTRAEIERWFGPTAAASADPNEDLRL